MKKTEYTVKEFATFTGVTERTLRYYDRIGLLKASRYSEKGHRLYEIEDLVKMQKILTLKYLGYSLTEIKENIIENNHHQLRDTLKIQKEMLINKREEIDLIIQTISKAEEIVQNNDISTELFLTIIHSIQHEQIKKDFFAKHMSNEFVNQALLENRSEKEKVEIEQRLVRILEDFQALKQQGLRPEDDYVQELTKQLFIILNGVLTPEIKIQIESLIEEYEAEFQVSFLPKDVQTFIEEAIRLYEESKNGLGNS